jgi:twitching motility protein PilU
VETPLTEEEARELVLSTMREDQKQSFLQHHECNYALSYEDLGRFRASAFVQRGKCGLVVRRIQTKIPTIDELGLPPIIKDLAMTKRGLVIFVGATGTGKSTSLVAMVGYRNQNSHGHIISIEDPIEYIHEHGNCIVTQREVGMDTESFDVALKNTLRQAPDVIMIGEVRSAETMAQALTFAETGHLCLCTLHANNANQALDRIQSFFPAELHSQVWMDLSLNLKSMVAQQGEVHLIKDLMAKSTELGMQTLDQSLVKAYKDGIISKEDALRYADSANDVRLQIKMFDKTVPGARSSREELGLSFDTPDPGRFTRR